MLCPNCSQTMDYVNLDNQSILHCNNCGCSFFDENGINRISKLSAQKLAKDKKNSEISGKEKLCPRDKTVLVAIQDESIPQDVSLLRCSKCNGIFAYPDDLIFFKKAQSAKINFLKIWKMPIPSLKTVLVFSFLGIISLSLIAGFNSIQKKQINKSQAQDLINKINISTSGPYLFISFRTGIPLYSEIVFEDKTTGKKTVKSVSEKPNTLHYITTGDINLKNEVFYKIILIDEVGEKTETTKQKLDLQ